MNIADYNHLVIKFASPEKGCPDTCEYVVEECAELIQAIQHMKRGRAGSRDKVVNEMADVYTLMDALRYKMGVSMDDIGEYQQALIDRYLNAPNDGRHVPKSV